MASTSEQKELELVEKVDFRILGVSNNEEKLQQLLKIYLPPLLLKAGSEHASVRNKVCMTRVLSRPHQHIPVRLPIYLRALATWQASHHSLTLGHHHHHFTGHCDMPKTEYIYSATWVSYLFICLSVCVPGLLL